MSKPESQMRAVVLKALRSHAFHAEAVDNEQCSPGTADITYCGNAGYGIIEGWCELKCLPAWPKRPDTIVRIDHYTQQQRDWLRDRWYAGGMSSLLLRVGDPRRADWLLFGGAYAYKHVGRVTKDQLRAQADASELGSPCRADWLLLAFAKMHGKFQRSRPFPS